MRYNLRAITTQTRDLETALLYQADDISYLFSCPDIFQRIAAAQKVRFNKVLHFFLPALGPDYFSGFMGFYLSAREGVNDLDSWQICLFGPRGLRDLMRASTFDADYFTNVQIVEFPDNLEEPLPSQSQDEDVKMDEPDAAQKTSARVELYFDTTMSRVAFKDSNVTVYPIRAESKNDSNKAVLSFYCVPVQSRGKFQPKIATQLGCKPKEHFKVLTAGETVTLADGTVITPDMVTEKPQATKACELVFLPDETYVESFLSLNARFHEQIQMSDENRPFNTALVYQAASMEVLRNPLYQENFIAKFPQDATHCFDNKKLNYEEYARPKAWYHTSLVREICPSLTPVIAQVFNQGSQVALMDDVVDEIKARTQMEQFSVIRAQSGLQFEYPKGALDKSQVTALTQEAQKANQEHFIEFIKKIAALRPQVLPEEILHDTILKGQQENPSPVTEVLEEPQVLFLGTSSMKPTQHRGASAIYVFNKKAGLLMDVAEGTYGQLYDHFFTKEAVSELLRLTRVILITHIHGDHAFGIYKMLLERDRALQLVAEEARTPVYCVIPTLMMHSVEYFVRTEVTLPHMIKLIPSNIFNPESERYYAHLHEAVDPSVPYEDRIPNDQELCPRITRDQAVDRLARLGEGKPEIMHEMFGVMSETLGFEKLAMVEVNHCAEAYCTVLVSEQHGNVLYSGDTLPCNSLRNYAQTCKVLIHEATLQVGMEEDAARKMHTTTGQVLEIAKECGIWRTILTHFSPRYQKIAEITPEMLQADSSSFVAFDHTRLSWSQLEWAPRILGLYAGLLSNEDEKKVAPAQEESKTNKKQKPQKQKKAKAAEVQDGAAAQ